MLRIGFVFPSSDYLFDPFKGDPHTHLHLLTILEDRFGTRVDLKLIDLRGIKREFAMYHIPECDVYLHSVYTLDWDEQLFLLKEIRNRYPKALHIAGGPHANFFPEESEKLFDALVFGEGEDTIVEAIADVMAGKLKKVYRQVQPIDINKYSFALRKFQPHSTVARKGMLTLKNKSGFDELLGTTVMFSRGCPYRCHFCAMPRMKDFAAGIRFRSPSWIEKEIEYLKSAFGIQGINLHDEIGIPLTREKAIPHLEAIGRTGIVWRSQCRVDGVTDEMASLTRASGCVALGMGVESVSQVSLDVINKKIDVETTKKAIRILKAHDIEVRVYMILGLPGEPEDIVRRTWEFIEETGPDLVILSLFTVRPGTEIFNHPKKFGIKKVETDWSKNRHMYGRYADEVPSLTFEYDEVTPWGKSIPPQQIVANYLELQSRLRSHGLSSLPSPAETHLATHSLSS